MVCRQIHLRLTPWQLFSTLRDESYPFLLESALAGTQSGRYSIAGANPFLLFRSRSRTVTLQSLTGTETRQGNPFEILRSLLRGFRLDGRPVPAPFGAGAVGYFAYDLCHFVESLPSTAQADIDLPECHLAFYGASLVYDHMLGMWYCAGYPEAVNELTRKVISRRTPDVGPPGPLAASSPPQGNFSRESYLEAVRRAIEYIRAGDIFQVNLSQRFEAELRCSPYELYQRLRAVNPAPFAAFLPLDDGAVISSSPERFLKVVDRKVETRPIKGTRPRGRTSEEDRAMRDELWRSEKDNAELAMIVDLERNDLGRVCSYGTVQVTEPKVLEEYPTVYHLVATVVGRLHEGKDLIDLLKATFPGGSITGAPKIRAMQIIDELEPTRRSVYTGAIGYIGFNGDMQLNIAIRTILAAGGRAYFQVGGGIVADSDPELEYEETLHKGVALFKALGF